MKNCLLLIFSILFLTGCAKKDDPDVLTIDGYITDEKNQQPVKDADIMVVGKVSGMGWNLFPSKEYKTKTDQNGYFKLQFSPYLSADYYELSANEFSESTAYSFDELWIPADSLHSERNRSVSIKLKPATTLRIIFKNASPVNDSDLFHFWTYTDQLVSFKKADQLEVYGSVTSEYGDHWLGKDVHASRTGQSPAEEYAYIRWTVQKNNVIKDFNDSVYCPRDKETSFEINY